ncbi:hypothetical protein BpHYR1_028942 [Brachionus plicatilis]|uniref:Uncharacterized protein n=1 Tax=Brachionus plicatilis TaxID=10195 RepID=A0A3M7S074_BRAPC|nr:hypothetical protein BpHYR1_028942 [Brachionus plicatilis]
MDPYKRTLNRPKFSETVTVSAVAGQLFGGWSFDRSARWSNFRTAKINGLKIRAKTVQKLDRLADRSNDCKKSSVRLKLSLKERFLYLDKNR